jgi:hypothetical protein
LFGEAGGHVKARPGERPDGRAAGRAGFLGEQVAVGVVAVVRVGDAVDATVDSAQGLRAGRGGAAGGSPQTLEAGLLDW